MSHPAERALQHPAHRDHNCLPDLADSFCHFSDNNQAGKDPSTIPRHCRPYRTSHTDWQETFQQALLLHNRLLWCFCPESCPDIYWQPIYCQVSAHRPSNTYDCLSRPALQIPIPLRSAAFFLPSLRKQQHLHKIFPSFN
jgi:hypothetical protein